MPVRRLDVGPWDVSHPSTAKAGSLGLLVVEGVLAREVLLGGDRSTELIGPGDLIRPCEPGSDVRLLSLEIRWRVVADAALAVLDRPIAAALGRFPEIAVALLDRADRRAGRLAAEKAIAHLRTVDTRLPALFWLLAERWGRRTADGVAVPLALSHRVLGELVGARRPTVSTSLARLARQGTLGRRSDGSWLLSCAPDAAPGLGGGRFASRRTAVVTEA